MNSTFLKTAPLLLAAGFALGGSAVHAQVTINYSLGSYSFFAPNGDADFMTAASPSTTALTLTPGVAQTVNIQAVYFDVYPTSDSGDDYIGTLSRSLTVDGITQSAAQGFDLTTNQGDGVNTLYADDSLIFYPSSTPIDFNLGSQGVLQFTPETLDGSGIFDADSSEDGVSGLTYFDNVKGKFLLTPAAVPEASSLVSTGLLLTLGLGALALRSRKRSATNA